MIVLGGILAIGAGVGFYYSFFWWPHLLTAAILTVFHSKNRISDTIFLLLSLLILFWVGVDAPSALATVDLEYGIEKRFTGRVLEDPLKTPGGFRVKVALEKVAEAFPGNEWRDARGQVLLSVRGADISSAAKGDFAIFRSPLYRPYGFRNPGSLWYRLYLDREGVVAKAHADYPGEVLFSKPLEADGVARKREEISRAIERSTSPEAGAFLKAITLGDRRSITEKVNELFRKTGTSHLLAVSALHLGIVGFVVYLLFRYLWAAVPHLALRVPAQIAAKAISMPFVLFYAFVTGFQTSTKRALLMGLFLIGASSLSKKVKPFNILLSAVFALIAIDPLLVSDPGLHLSVAAIAGILWITPRGDAKRDVEEDSPVDGVKALWVSFLRLVGRKALQILSVSLIATLMTVPLVVFHFGGASLGGFFFNPIAVPLVTFLCLPLSLGGALLYCCWEKGGEFLFGLSGVGADLLFTVLRIELPFEGEIGYPFGTFIPVLGFWLLLGALIFLIRKRINLSRWFLLTFFSLFLIFIPPFLEKILLKTENFAHGWVFDVGQGQSVAVMIPGEGFDDPQWLVVDGGGFPASSFDTGESIVYPALKHLGMDKLDYLVSSHPHPDHLKGLQSLVVVGKPEKIFLPENFKGDKRYDPIMEAADKVNAEVVWAGSAGVRKRTGEGALHLIPSKGRSENDRSLVVVVEYAGSRITVPGDIEIEGQNHFLKENHLTSGGVMVAPHHGSSDAVSIEFYKDHRPRAIVVSAGQGKGLPSKELLRIADGLDTQVVATAEEGAVHIIFGYGSYFIETNLR